VVATGPPLPRGRRFDLIGIRYNRSIGLDETHPLLAACHRLAVRQRLADSPKSKNAKVILVYQHELPNVPGKSIKGVLVEYGPGGYSPGHTHAKSAFIYATVLEGAIRGQVNDGPVTTYQAGQCFSELPGDRHAVNANASKTKPAKLLAVFVVDANETELTIPFAN